MRIATVDPTRTDRYGVPLLHIDYRIRENERVMQVSVERGRRPRSIYRGSREGCPRCGGRIRSRGQGDANRTAYWCEACQR